MDRAIMAMLAVLALSGCTTRESATGDSAMTSAPAAFSVADESAVRALVNEFANTWNRHDMNAMHELDTEDVEWINVVGHHWRGKAMVYKGHDVLHRSMAAKSDMSVESAIVRPIAPTVAVAVATMHFGANLDPRWPTGPAAKTRGTFIMVKRDGIWKIVHFQNTIINPATENNDLINWDEATLLPRRDQ